MSENSKATRNEIVLRGIIQGMSDGVIILDQRGRVKYINPAAAGILDIEPEALENKSILSAFFEYEENDHFNQTILDTFYDPEQKHHDLVPYYTGTEFRQLHLTTSVLWVDEVKSGVIMILNDITEISSLRIEYTRQITALLDSLVKAFSSAIDERSSYTANHTRNMVRLGTAFLDWLKDTDAPLQFKGDRRQAFLMSIWLHDVGKLTIPLEVMDKATRLSDHLNTIAQRLNRIHLLDRIAELEGRIDAQTFREREEQRDELLTNIRRINAVGFLGEDDLKYVQQIAQLQYPEEDGSWHPMLTEEEILCLQIRKGTLTDAERSTMQSHATMTRKILENVEFPESFADVPDWASSHHEFLNGTGYPDHRTGDSIPPEVRLLTILDIFEALTAEDRPYKDPIPPERSLKILHQMAEEGCIDGDILNLFEESRVWESVKR